MTLIDDQPKVRGTRFRRRVLVVAIVVVLLAFFSVPIAIILYGGAAMAMGGLIMIGLLILCELPAFILLKKLGLLPVADRNDDN